MNFKWNWYIIFVLMFAILWNGLCEIKIWTYFLFFSWKNSRTAYVIPRYIQYVFVDCLLKILHTEYLQMKFPSRIMDTICAYTVFGEKIRNRWISWEISVEKYIRLPYSTWTISFCSVGLKTSTKMPTTKFYCKQTESIALTKYTCFTVRRA